MSDATTRPQEGRPREALYNVGRSRTDAWHRLRDAARRLARGGAEDPEQAPRLRQQCRAALEALTPLEAYFAFPGHRAVAQVAGLVANEDWPTLSLQVTRLVRLLTTGIYRRLDLQHLEITSFADLLSLREISAELQKKVLREQRPYFEVLVVDDITDAEEAALQLRLRQMRRRDDAFIYEVVVVRRFEDAVMASLANPTLQSVVVRFTFPFREGEPIPALEGVYRMLGVDREALERRMPADRSLQLGRMLKSLRAELDLFLVSDAPVEEVAGERSRGYRRVFYQAEDLQDLHLGILKGVHERYETPFFSALRKYSLKPTGVFHALPIARGKSISRSNWIGDLEEFYGPQIFQAETSATTGGLDSLLQPVGTIKRAQELAARAFGSRNTYFVTNGTSTANKIVMQALMQPGDIVLLSHDCHKSHPYAVILAGAHPVYLDAYPLSRYSIYGGVPLHEIKRQLLALRREGKLDRVKLLLLTSITFDGICYHPLRVMEEILAIKPDIVFLWDEAWFAYGRFAPVLRRRTAMEAANLLRERLRSPEYAEAYAKWQADFAARAGDEAAWLGERLMPDPATARVRVYATQSTHKTLTAMRQGSMIHVNDQDFEHGVRAIFNEAYMTHTSTSPNYQILATLDSGRRQVELEGYDLVGRSIQLAMTLRERIREDPMLKKYFRVLGPEEMVPDAHRPSGLRKYYDPEAGWADLEPAWGGDEFTLDPTRITLDIGRTGMDGNTFKQLLMDRYDIQINKTSRNTVLFMIHIGMSRGMGAHLITVLTQIARDLDEARENENAVEREIRERHVRALVDELPPLPNFSRFHDAFRPDPGGTTIEGQMREAFFLSYDDAACTYVPLAEAHRQVVEQGQELVSAAFVTPYPPGFPILMPGQVMTDEILTYLTALDVKEIHGYEAEFGLRTFRPEALARLPAGGLRPLSKGAPA
mgnify:CR=1 FL=1